MGTGLYACTCISNTENVSRFLNVINYLIHNYDSIYIIIGTVEPLSKGHFGASSLVGKLSSFQCFGDIGSVHCMEVVPFSEGPLLEVI